MTTDQTIAADWPVRAKARMKDLLVTQADLSRAVGYKSHESVRRHLEGEAVPAWDVLEVYAKTLHCTPAWLARAEGAAPAAVKAQRLMVAESKGLYSLDADKDIGARFKKARVSSGYDQPTLAKLVKCSKQQVSRLEQGKTPEPGVKIVLRYEDKTGYSVRWLATGQGPEMRGGTPTSEINPDIMVNAVRLLRQAMERSGRTDLSAFVQGRILAHTYTSLAAGRAPDDTVLDALVSALA